MPADRALGAKARQRIERPTIVELLADTDARTADPEIDVSKLQREIVAIAHAAVGQPDERLHVRQDGVVGVGADAKNTHRVVLAVVGGGESGPSQTRLRLSAQYENMRTGAGALHDVNAVEHEIAP